VFRKAGLIIGGGSYGKEGFARREIAAIICLEMSRRVLEIVVGRCTRCGVACIGCGHSWEVGCRRLSRRTSTGNCEDK
jgi:hypothetical protein